MGRWVSSGHALELLVDALGPGPWSRSDLLAFGWSIEQVRAAEGAGRIHRVRRGVYAAGVSDVHAAIKAALRTSPEGSVASHESGLRVAELWLPIGASSLVHLTKPGAIERTHQGVRIHGSRLPSEFVTEIDGIPVTSAARTALDVARGCTLPEALVVVDSAARHLIAAATGADLRVLRSPVRRAELTPLAVAALEEAFAVLWTWPGTVVARAAIELVDPASESASESRSRGWMHEAKLPMPLTAYEVQGASGAWYASEFAWPGKRLLGEVDGFGKYGVTEGEVRRSLQYERHRQADLEDAGWRFVRWTSLERRSLVIRRIGAALTDPMGVTA